MSDGDTTRVGDDAPFDWSRFDAMTDEEHSAAALADPDARPLSEEDMASLPRTPQAKVIRRALGLSQDEFARRFQIPSARCAIGSRAARNRTAPRGPTSW